MQPFGKKNFNIEVFCYENYDRSGKKKMKQHTSVLSLHFMYMVYVYLLADILHCDINSDTLNCFESACKYTDLGFVGTISKYV